MKCLEEKEFGCFWNKTISMDAVTRRLYFSKEPLEKFEHRKLLRDDITKGRSPLTESIPLEILMIVYGYYTIES